MLAHVIGFLAAGLLIFAFTQLNHSRLLFITALACIAWTTHYWLLGAMAAAATYAFSAARLFVTPWILKQPSTVKAASTLLVIVVHAAIGAVAWAGPTTLLPLAAGTLIAVGGLWLIGLRYRLMSASSDVLFFLVALTAGSLAGMLMNAALLALDCRAVYRLRKDNAS